MRAVFMLLQSLRVLSLTVRVGLFLLSFASAIVVLILARNVPGGHSLVTLLMLPVALAAWLFSARVAAFCLIATYIVDACFATWMARGLSWPLPVIVAFTLFALTITAEACSISLLRYALERSQALQQKELRARQELSFALQRQQMLSDLQDQFFLNMSHELCTPLTELKGYIELLREHHTRLDSATQAEFLDHIAHGCNELELIVSSVLEAAHLDRSIQAARCEAVNIASVVDATLDSKILQTLSQHDIRVRVPEELTAWTDPKQLQQVLYNLLSNALKYAPPSSSVIVSAMLLDDQPDPFVPSVCIRVQDAGPGIPASDQPLLFRKAVRLQRDMTGNVRGSGLGLHISKQLVESMGGRIWVESSGVPGQGSCFCFTLPCASVPAMNVNTDQYHFA